jgi:hypothetical protein
MAKNLEQLYQPISLNGCYDNTLGIESALYSEYNSETEIDELIYASGYPFVRAEPNFLQQIKNISSFSGSIHESLNMGPWLNASLKNNIVNINPYKDNRLKGNDMSSDTYKGVPKDFISSFGNYVAMKFFLEGVENKRQVYSYIEKDISNEDHDKIDKLFGQCRTISRSSSTIYEYYNEDIGYIAVCKEKAINNHCNVKTAIGFEQIHALLENAGKTIVKEPVASWVTGFDQYGEIILKSFSIKEIHKYNPVFYPFMNGQDIQDFAKKYLESNASILLLIGPPGTAKTSFIRQLLQATGESVLLTYSDEIKTKDNLFSYFYDSPEKFLIIEDADTYIEKRENGNTNMKQLLNITDGLTANPDKKVIFSTNLPNINSVDPALIRAGRCYDILHFDRLQGDDLLAAIDFIDPNHEKFKNITMDHYTVAELFQILNGEEHREIKNVSRFGFTG